MRSREKVAWVLVAAIVMLAASEWTFFHPESSRYSREFLIVVGALGTALFGGAAVATIMQLAFPARLTLSAAGLVYAGPYWRRAWAWADLGEFVIEKEHGWRVIRFDAPRLGPKGLARGDRREILPGCWRLSLVEVRDVLNATPLASAGGSSCSSRREEGFDLMVDGSLPGHEIKHDSAADDLRPPIHGGRVVAPRRRSRSPRDASRPPLSSRFRRKRRPGPLNAGGEGGQGGDAAFPGQTPRRGVPVFGCAKTGMTAEVVALPDPTPYIG